MKVAASTIKKGDFIQINDAIYSIQKFEHNFHGRGSANIRLKLKNVRNGSTTENTFKPDNLVEKISVDSVQMQYLFSDTNTLTFMNQQTYEQLSIDKEMVGDLIQFLKEGQQLYILLYNGDALAVRPPQSVTLEVVEAEEAARGDTATNPKKQVTLETGAVVQVPLFIKRGELITIDPETGSYIERASS